MSALLDEWSFADELRKQINRHESLRSLFEASIEIFMCERLVAFVCINACNLMPLVACALSRGSQSIAVVFVTNERSKGKSMISSMWSFQRTHGVGKLRKYFLLWGFSGMQIAFYHWTWSIALRKLRTENFCALAIVSSFSFSLSRNIFLFTFCLF